ncbi:FecR family protein [Cerasicoccus fimbriatus]|uniref:FecR family protein n=1 Tax=Cerasicoccus fimbriatus TaxID=3014554 RepID=UPI0022B48DFD|nr:FecR family protein [Cerasicoccus sp. TK19100]
MKILKLITLAASMLCLANVATAQEKVGVIKAFLVKGDVKIVNNATGAVSPLKRGQEFSEGNTIVTGDNSTTLLLFSNGASINITPNSSFDVNTFQQESYDPALGSFLRLEKDPSMSNTQTNLAYGEIIGEVRKLNIDAGSNFVVKTPVASAGIRGTVWVVNYDPATGEFSASNVNGAVDVILPSGETITVAEGETHVVVNSTSSTEPLSPEVLAAARQFIATQAQVPTSDITVSTDSTIVSQPDTTIITEEAGTDPSQSEPVGS